MVDASLLVPSCAFKKKDEQGFSFFFKGRAMEGTMSLGRCEWQHKGGGRDSLARWLLVLIKLSNPDEATETER